MKILLALLLALAPLPALAQTIPSTYNPGEIRVQVEPGQLFYDGFDTGLDTTNKWNAPVSGGGGVAASNVVSFTRLGTGTTANGFSYLQTQTTFQPVSPGWLTVGFAINLEFPVSINAYRFWGIGSVPGTPTAAIPITDGAGFEVTTTGKLFAVMYSGGTRSFAQDLSVATGSGKQPQDSSPHIYYLFYRGDQPYWAIDSQLNIVAGQQTGINGPNVNTLPITLEATAGSTPPVSSVVLQDNGTFMGDTTNRATQVADGSFPWRKATVDRSGSLFTTSGGGTTVAIAAATVGPTVIKATPGRLMRALITTAGTTGTETFFDNASACSGTIIGIIPGTTAVTTAVAGTPYDIEMIAANGITACGAVGSAALTVSFN